MPRKRPAAERGSIGFADTKNLVTLMNDLEAVNDELFIRSGELVIWHNLDYPVGTLMRARNDDEWYFVPFDSEHDDES